MERKEHRVYGFFVALVGAIIGSVGYVFIRDLGGPDSHWFTALGGFAIAFLTIITYLILNRGIVSKTGILINGICGLLFLAIGEIGFIVYETSIASGLSITETLKYLSDILQFMGLKTICEDVAPAACIWFAVTVIGFVYAMCRKPKAMEITK